MTRRSLLLVVVFVVLAAACTSGSSEDGSGVEVSSTTQVASEAAATAPSTVAVADGPVILGVEPGAADVGRFEYLEMVVDIDAEYDNPYDQREVTLDGRFTGPDGSTWDVPGFWDGRDSWMIRFTPSVVGEWSFEVAVADRRGTVTGGVGTFSVVESDRRGWLQNGDWVDPSYSPHYFAYMDGTPFYGSGHADLEMTLGGYDADTGFRFFTDMVEDGENYAMWWPLWANSFIDVDYDRYKVAQLELIDLVMADAERHDVQVIYTIWNHQLLRTNNHRWLAAKWEDNAFKKITDVAGFFVDDEAWAWQENLYRYTIARWSHSTSLGMWQTITEINGTESYEQTDPWHERINAYFQANDPYRHPTTATQSGSVDWPAGHAVMDAPQMHLYEFVEDPIEGAAQTAFWADLMWNRADKPNWVGEYGERGPQFYPEMYHYANWSSLAAGAAMAPTEWNDETSYGVFTPEMAEDSRRFRAFVDTVPLVQWDPQRVDVVESPDFVRGWGVVGRAGGVVWVQDYELEGAGLAAQQAASTLRSSVAIAVDLPEGVFEVTPYNTWTGEWLAPFEIACSGIDPCRIDLPDFTYDLALRLEG